MNITIARLRKWTENQLGLDWRSSIPGKSAEEQLIKMESLSETRDSNLKNDNLVFSKMLLPHDLFMALFESKNGKLKSAPTISRIANGESGRCFDTCASYFESLLKKNNYMYGEDPYSQHIQIQWNRLFDSMEGLSSEGETALSFLLTEKNFPKVNERESFLLIKNKYSISNVLTSLTFISCFQENWRKKAIYPMILPGDANPVILETGYYEAYQKGTEQYLKGNYNQAELCLRKAVKSENAQLSSNAYEMLGNVYLKYWEQLPDTEEQAGELKQSWANKAISSFKISNTGEAFYQLSQCYRNGTGRQPNEKKADFYLEKAIRAQNPNALLEKAVKLKEKQEVPAACALCRKIVELTEIKNISDIVKKDAYFMLYEYYDQLDINQLPNPIRNRELLLQLSAKAGHPEANRLLKEKSVSSILYLPEKGESREKGTCFFNVINEKSRLFLETLPEEWKHQYLMDENLNSVIDPVEQQLFLLLDDNAQNNLQNAIQILNEIANQPKKESGFWNSQIYLRADSEQAGPLIDAILSNMRETAVPVYILDDDKDSAQKLFSRHPLFYPIHKKTKDERRIIHLVILGTTRGAEWTVREAYHLLTFKEHDITVRITVLGQNMEHFQKHFYRKCPGMNPGTVIIDDLPLPELNMKEVDLYSTDLEEYLNSHCKDANYFVINAESDDNNLSLAIWLREYSIRRKIAEGADFAGDLPVIAFRCKNIHKAHLSKMLSVQLEPRGNTWYNNYRLIPFGTDYQLYTWQNINGGFLEWQARSVHLQYSNIEPGEAQETVLEHLWEYFSKQYNRDSSHAVAAFLPYRLFQYKKNRVVPELWDIASEDTFSNPQQLEKWAKQFNQDLSDSRKFHMKELLNLEELARMEHNRWVKFLLTRGWLPATVNQTISYIRQGNLKRQLYIAKLHPCICSYNDMEFLSQELKEKTGLNKDFYSIDLKNIERTGDILCAAWFSNTKVEKLPNDKNEL